MIAENRPALEAINNEMGLTAVSERMKGQAADDENQSTGVNDTLNEEQAVFKEVYNDIITAMEIKEDELLGLADARALAIKQYLVDNLKLSHERVSEIKAIKSDLSGRVIKLELDAM